MDAQLDNILMEYDRTYLLSKIPEGKVDDLPEEYAVLKQHIKDNYTGKKHENITIKVSQRSAYTPGTGILVSQRVAQIYSLYTGNMDYKKSTTYSVSCGFSGFEGENTTVEFLWLGAPMHKVTILTNITSLTVNQPTDLNQELEMLEKWRPSLGWEQEVGQLPYEA